MSTHGFSLTYLKLSGSNQPDAKVEFHQGLNVVSGPSNTGKTYIAQCVDFVLGSQTLPKEITEARAYELVTLGLKKNSDGVEIHLERSLQGGPICLVEPGRTETLSSKHTANSGLSVSQYLLDLSGLEGKRVRKDRYGATRALSFREVSHLIYVSEESIIADRSPILTGGLITDTAEESVFRLLITGIDDSSIIQTVDPKKAKIRNAAEKELLEELVQNVRVKISELGIEEDATAIKEQLDRVNASFEAITSELVAEQSTGISLEAQRLEIWTDLKKVESRIRSVSELQSRFELLGKQYESDLHRLAAISEAGERLEEIPEKRCPVCGALAEYHDQSHGKGNASPADVVRACDAERIKIHSLLIDLHETISVGAGELQQLNECKTVAERDVSALTSKIRINLEPRLQLLLQKAREHQQQRERLQRAIELYRQIDEYEDLIASIRADKPKKPDGGEFRSVTSGATEDFSKEVESLLRNWNFPGLERVTFSENDMDLVISGKPRRSHGKGVRAITHAAFNLALLKYCKNKVGAHPGLVLLDSPLVVYRQPDPDERGFSIDLKTAFYRTVADEFSELQVIVFENDDPPTDIETSAHVIRFTGNDLGRWGFIPKQ